MSYRTFHNAEQAQNYTPDPCNLKRDHWTNEEVLHILSAFEQPMPDRPCNAYYGASNLMHKLREQFERFSYPTSDESQGLDTTTGWITTLPEDTVKMAQRIEVASEMRQEDEAE